MLRASQTARPIYIALALLSLQGSLSSCFGRFALTRKVYGFNESINDKWLRTIVTFVLVVIPVYGLSAFVDWVFFNTVEFWGGTNPIDGLNSDRPTPVAPPQLQTASGKTRDGERLFLSLSSSGEELRVELLTPSGERRALLLSMHGDSAELRDGSGQLIATLASDGAGEQTVRNAAGQIVAAKSSRDMVELESAVRSGGRALLAEMERQAGQSVAKR